MLKKDMPLSKEKKNGEFFVNDQKTTALKSPPPPFMYSIHPSTVGTYKSVRASGVV